MAGSTANTAISDNWREYLPAYASGELGFLPGLLPEEAVALPAEEVLALLRRRLGEGVLERCLHGQEAFPSPLAGSGSSSWVKHTDMVGVNIRTLGSFWSLAKYALTLPAHQRAIHLLPIWEPGVVASLYGMASWHINPEFFSAELQSAIPALDTVDKQLRAVVSLLHADGRLVGMDVIPHTDRYAEMVLANPQHFEWLKREGDQIVSHRAGLHEEVEEQVLRFLQEVGPAVGGLPVPASAADLFGPSCSEPTRLQLLFGQKEEYEKRGKRRGQLVQFLYGQGYEPVPATMAPPYRGLEVDPRPETQSTDGEGRTWYEYRITAPTEMSRVFGPLTRYKLYGRLDDNKDWAIDFSKPRTATWDYVCRHFLALQETFNFDFMRGDMSHVQMRPDGVPVEGGAYYDLHRAVKEAVQKVKPYFGYFAETFLAGPGFMAYGDENDHLELSLADATLGDLQSMVPGSPVFLQHFRRYLDLKATRAFAPAFTIMTGDKDDPRFDKFYLHGNEARYFAMAFLPDMPGYMGNGFECRDGHPAPAPNEHYTKLYVFRIGSGPKATHGPYVWGQNKALFGRLSRLRLLRDHYNRQLEGLQPLWLLPPDPTGATRVLAWWLGGQARLLAVVNFGEAPAQNLKIPRSALGLPPMAVQQAFSTHTVSLDKKSLLQTQGHWHLPGLQPGEGRIYGLADEGQL